jgi:hypothetical protein
MTGHAGTGFKRILPTRQMRGGFVVFAQQALSGGWWPEFIEQHSQGFTQLEPVAGGVCEQESALRNKASILD